MLLLLNPANEDVVTFLPHGKYFAIRRVDFTNQLLRKNFQLTCFEDFLEVAKRWGFISVNDNINEDGNNGGSNSSNNDTNNTNNGSGDESSNKNKRKVNSSSKTDIYVFRRSHFEKNRPVDMNKIKLQSEGVRKGQQQQCDSSVGGKAPPPTTFQNNASREKSNSDNKRELSPYHDNRDSTEDCRQRLRRKSKKKSDAVDRLSLADGSCDQPAQQLRRRSSKELRGVAQAITTSKIYLSNTSEVIKAEDDSNNMRHSQMIDNIDDRSSPLSRPDPILAPQLERGQSTGSSLVDGGVETATHTIVTDAIEALLFDENHTRETYNRHEKELSVSSLPGVVPISKQLFSASDNNGASSVIPNTDGGEKSDATEKRSNDRAKKAPTKPKLESSSPWAMYTSVGSLEDASKYDNDSGPCLSSNSLSNCENLRIVIPRDDGEARQQHESIYGYMVVSPARMEAAAALVSQSRIRNNEEL
mmetsp:Transcript_12754/g.26027  ORF Transcript_12754/g.26027 Transcript_12754/m.26027 type:complete len:473 (+) Transcript_12754:559-1977(+)